MNQPTNQDCRSNLLATGGTSETGVGWGPFMTEH
jgi:hypothetical protein